MSDIQKYVDLTNTIQLILMIRDMMAKKYQVSVKSYEKYLTEHIRDIKNLKFLLELVSSKIEYDSDTNENEWEVRDRFDLDGLKIRTHDLYIHFHIAPKITLAQLTQIKNHVRPSGQKEPSCIGVMHVGLDETVDESDVASLGGIIQIDMYRYLMKIEHYKSTMFNISSTENNICTINKILTAREIVCQMIQTRQYQGTVPFIYFNNLNAEFGHFKIDIESRYMLGKIQSRPLFEKNYFDIFGITKVSVDGKTVTPIYIHFLIEDPKDIKDFNDYLRKLEEQIRASLPAKNKDGPLYIIVILEPTMKIKEQYDYQILQDDKSSSRGDSVPVAAVIDIMPIKNLQYNPTTNVYQPKFRLIKAGTLEYKQIISDYGSEDAVPRINLTDPVNIFYGGKHRDIYEIIRNQITLVGDEKDSSMHKNPQLHFDVAHRLVR